MDRHNDYKFIRANIMLALFAGNHYIHGVTDYSKDEAMLFKVMREVHKIEGNNSIVINGIHGPNTITVGAMHPISSDKGLNELLFLGLSAFAEAHLWFKDNEGYHFGANLVEEIMRIGKGTLTDERKLVNQPTS